MRWALAALWLSLPALADPPPHLLPKEAPPAAIDFSGRRAIVLGTVLTGAALTAGVLVWLVITLSPKPYYFDAQPPLR